ncbi:uncharacterized protein LOC120267869 [Dioscorea cayenensis subsp. rotundata]|uniref:Uncharacterized protein LOC120267869 n=1 Tax=Dioscorea cayennensis subsp. rotundata TaxID=55577 RepID=A0AB40BY79_DIOCR|nr:uncharacterized protein LOC120267869 [Dioscorea cayenensis subsp. rotundata]
MDGASQIALPVLGILAAAALTFYAVSFAELREKSFRDLDDESKEEEDGGGFQSSASSRERRAWRKAKKNARK